MTQEEKDNQVGRLVRERQTTSTNLNHCLERRREWLDAIENVLKAVDLNLRHRRQDAKEIEELLIPLPEKTDMLANEKEIVRLLTGRSELTSKLRALGISVD